MTVEKLGEGITSLALTPHAVFTSSKEGRYSGKGGQMLVCPSLPKMKPCCIRLKIKGPFRIKMLHKYDEFRGLKRLPRLFAYEYLLHHS